MLCLVFTQTARLRAPRVCEHALTCRYVRALGEDAVQATVDRDLRGDPDPRAVRRGLAALQDHRWHRQVPAREQQHALDHQAVSCMRSYLT